MATGLSELSITAPAILVLSLISSASAYAQVATDGTVGPRVRLGGPDFQIGADLGRRAGGNLFHSFERFSLDAGERATFSGPGEIDRIISRVTGGARSDIDGTLRSTIPGADFYFLNPAGIAFGPNARLDLQGSFHVSTADELRFADGARFSATNPAASSFTVAAPEAFGFLRAEPASITVDGSRLRVPADEAISIIGGDVTIGGGNNRVPDVGEDGTVRAEGGRAMVVALSGPGEARVVDGAATGNVFADIRLTDQASIDVSGDGGGTVRVRGGHFAIESESGIIANNTGPMNARGGILLEAEAVTVGSGSVITSNALGTGDAAGLAIRASEVLMTDGAAIASFSEGVGEGGRIVIQARDIFRSTGASVTAQAPAAVAGDIFINAGQLIYLFNTEISSTNGFGGGDIGIGLRFFGAVPEFVVLNRSSIAAVGIPGVGGDTFVETERLILSRDSFLVATGGGVGIDGTVFIIFGEELDELPALDAPSQLRERCASRRDIGASSFTGVGRGGLPPSPDGPLVAAYLVDEAAVGAARKAGSRLTTVTAPADVRLAGLSAPCAPLD